MAHTRIRAILAAAILRDDHRKVMELFSQYERIGKEAVADSRLELFHEIRTELTIPSQVEEELFDPAIESLRKDDEAAGQLVRGVREDHQTVRSLLDELGELEPELEEFDERMKSLIEIMSDHADKEEEEIFPYFDELPREERIRVSDELQARKAELTQEYGGG